MPPAATRWTSSTGTSWRAWCASTCPRRLPSEKFEQEKSPAGSVARRGSGLRSPSLLIERHHLEARSLVVHRRVEHEGRAVRAVLQLDGVRSLREHHVVRAHVRRVSRVAHHHVRARDDGVVELEVGHDRAVHRDREVERDRHRAGVRHHPVHLELGNGVPVVVVHAVPLPVVRGGDGAHGGDDLGHAGRPLGTGRTDQTLWAGGAGNARRTRRTLRTNGAVSTSGALRTRGTGYALRTGCALRSGRALRTCCTLGAVGTGYTLRAGGALRTGGARGTRGASGARKTVMTHRSRGTLGTFHTHIALGTLGASRTSRARRASRTSRTSRARRTRRTKRTRRTSRASRTDWTNRTSGTSRTGRTSRTGGTSRTLRTPRTGRASGTGRAQVTSRACWTGGAVGTLEASGALRAGRTYLVPRHGRLAAPAAAAIVRVDDSHLALAVDARRNHAVGRGCGRAWGHHAQCERRRGRCERHCGEDHEGPERVG